MSDRNRRLGIIEILVSGVCFGFLGLFGKRALARGIEPGEFLALRYCLAAAMMAVLVFFRVRNWRALWLGRRAILQSLLLGIFGYAVFSSFYFLALARISASMTVILLYLYPVFVATGGVFFFAERIPRSRLAALPMALAGLAFLVWPDLIGGSASPGGEASLGVFFGFLSALCYSIYILLSAKWLKALDPWASTMWIQLGAGVSLLLVNFKSLGRVFEVTERVWPELLGISFICSVLAMALFLSGLLRVQKWEASILSMAEPITGVAIGVLVLGESLFISQWLGAGLVLLALGIVSLPSGKNSQKVDSIRGI